MCITHVLPLDAENSNKNSHGTLLHHGTLLLHETGRKEVSKPLPHVLLFKTPSLAPELGRPYAAQFGVAEEQLQP